MKKTIILFAMLLAVAGMAAQTQSLGFQVGFDRPRLLENSQSSPNKLSEISANNGFKVGFVYDATLIKGFGFSLAFNYSFAGSRTAWQQANSFSTAQKKQYRDIVHTIELPIDWQYKFEIAQQTYLILYTGPVVQYNIAYTRTVYEKDEVAGTTSSKTLNHYSADNPLDGGSKYGDLDKDGKADFTPFNLQWGIGAGFQYKNYYLRGGYNFGIYNHYKDMHFTNADGTTEYKMRARFDAWSIRIGIYFLNF